MDRISDWLIAEGPYVADMGALLSGLAERLLAAGIPVARMAAMIETLHPRFVGAMRVWEPGGDVRLRRATFDDPSITNAPKIFTIDLLQESGDWVDFRLDDPRIAEFDLLPRLALEGHTHYLLMPIRFREGPLQGLSFSTKQPGGFTQAQCAAIRSLQPAVAIVMNVIATHIMWREVLKAFVGEVPGELILQGAIRRADVRRVEAALVHASASLGIDLAALGLDDELPEAPGNAIQSNVTALRAAAPRATQRALVDRMILGSRQPPILGSAEEVADALIAWVDEVDVDGFNLSRTVIPDGIEDVVELLVPVLQDRGRYKRGYAAGTYREKLFGAGPRLAAPHPAAAMAR